MALGLLLPASGKGKWRADFDGPASAELSRDLDETSTRGRGPPTGRGAWICAGLLNGVANCLGA